MLDTEKQAILSLCQEAMMADGSASASEQQSLGRAAARLGIQIPASNVATAGDLVTMTDPLRGGGFESTAFEMAWAICAADGPPNAPEQWFLEALRVALGISPQVAEGIRGRVADIVVGPVVPPSLDASPEAPPVIPMANPNPAEPDVQDIVQSTAITAGALELLPHPLATLAIVPLQVRLVYRIGKSYGYELDSGHIREFFTVAGVGLASQIVESFAERAARGLFGGLLGGFTGHLVSQASGSGVAFAATYALGELARQYYAGGRQFSGIELREAYHRLLERGRSIQSDFAPHIRSQSGRIDPGTLASLVRG